jgi:hypothetical protein
MMVDTRKRGSERVIAKVTGCAAAREAALVGASQMKRLAASRRNAWGRRLRGRARHKVGGRTVDRGPRCRCRAPRPDGPARAARWRRRKARPPFAGRVQVEGRGQTGRGRVASLLRPRHPTHRLTRQCRLPNNPVIGPIPRRPNRCRRAGVQGARAEPGRDVGRAVIIAESRQGWQRRERRRGASSGRRRGIACGSGEHRPRERAGEPCVRQ